MSGDRLEIVVTMRNDGNVKDGLIVSMTSSYFTEMSFIPPDNAIVEDDTQNIRSFEIIDIEREIILRSEHGQKFLIIRTQRTSFI